MRTSMENRIHAESNTKMSATTVRSHLRAEPPLQNNVLISWKNILPNYFKCKQSISASPTTSMDCDPVILRVIPMILTPYTECDVRVYLINNEVRSMWNGQYKGALLQGTYQFGMNVAVNLSLSYKYSPRIFILPGNGVQSFSLRVETRLLDEDGEWISESPPFNVYSDIQSCETPLRSKRKRSISNKKAMSSTSHTENRSEGVEGWHAHISRDLAISPLTLPPPMEGYGYTDDIKSNEMIERGDAIVGKVKKSRIIKGVEVDCELEFEIRHERAKRLAEAENRRERRITKENLGKPVARASSEEKIQRPLINPLHQRTYPFLQSPTYPFISTPLVPPPLLPHSVVQSYLSSPSSTYSGSVTSSPIAPSPLTPSSPKGITSSIGIKSPSLEPSSPVTPFSPLTKDQSTFLEKTLTSPLNSPTGSDESTFSTPSSLSSTPSDEITDLSFTEEIDGILDSSLCIVPPIVEVVEAIIIDNVYEPLSGERSSGTSLDSTAILTLRSHSLRENKKQDSSLTPLLKGLTVETALPPSIPSPRPCSLLLPDTSRDKKIFKLSKSYWMIPLRSMPSIQEPLKITQISDEKISLPDDVTLRFSSEVTVEKGKHYDVKNDQIVLFSLPNNIKKQYMIPYCEEISINIFFGNNLVQSDKFYLRFHSGI